MSTDSEVRTDVQPEGEPPGRDPSRVAPPPAPPPGEDPATSFDRKPATRWLSPGLLLRSAGEVVVSSLMGQYNDKRELMGSLEADDPLDLRTGCTDVWVDYVSDTGDGFDATYAVASLLAQESLPLEDPTGEAHPTERGRLLLMGGDQVYPSADVQEYEHRLIGPFRAALTSVEPTSAAPHLLAVPGNHDWYDGLTAFMRTFCQRRWIGGWRTSQSRSYFAVRLPGRWWLWGIDIQFDTYIDDVQRRFFEKAAHELVEGDAVILCSAKPSWVSTSEGDDEAYATLDFVDRTLIRPRGARLRVCISGDRHHYARYAAADGGQRITAGGGGAYLTPTHHLRPTITVPPPGSRARGRTDPVPFERESVYPAPEQSRRLARGVLRLPWETRGFTVFMGLVQALLALAMLWALGGEQLSLPKRVQGMARALETATPDRLVTALADSLLNLLIVLVVLGGAIAFTKKARTWTGRGAGLVHGLFHLALAVLVTWGVATVLSPLLPGGPWLVSFLLLLAFAVLASVAGGVLATELVAVYLLLVDRFGLNSNELYAAQAIPDHKNFLRLHVGEDGDLRIYPVGLEKVPRSWEDVEGPVGPGQRIVPDGPGPTPFLIEEPVVVSPDPRSSTSAGGAR